MYAISKSCSRSFFLQEARRRHKEWKCLPRRPYRSSVSLAVSEQDFPSLRYLHSLVLKSASNWLSSSLVTAIVKSDATGAGCGASPFHGGFAFAFGMVG